MSARTKTEHAALLAKAPFFERLSENLRARLSAPMERKLFGQGEAIFARGDEARALYVVVSGNVRLSVLSEEGRELTLLHAGPGALFGEIGCFDGLARTTDATALVAVEALVLQRRDLVAVLRDTPDLALAIIGFLGERLRATNDRLEAVAFHSVETRLARFFLAQARAAGLNGRKAPLRLDMSQGEIGLLIAASRPKVNAALSMLEDKGAVRRAGKDFLCDLDKLEPFAGLED